MEAPRDVEKSGVTRSDDVTFTEHQHKHIDSRLATDEPAEAGFSSITGKTWVAISLLSSSVGISFWPVPTTSPMIGVLGAQFNDAQSSAWFLSSFTTGCALGFLTSGTNSDLFGRRVIVLMGNLLSAIGAVICATSHRSDQFIGGMSILGFASGMSQLGLIGVPELMPNKYRHIGIIISDAVLFPILICGPIIGRYAVNDPTSRTWTWVYWATFIAMIINIVGVYFCYQPPKHPRGVPWKTALRGLDYIGMVLVTGGVALTLIGIVYTTYQPASSAIVLGPLISGICLLAVFGVWENVSNVPYKLCPPAIFSYNWGRDFTVPFIFGAIITMYYYAAGITYPTMVAVFYTTPETPVGHSLALSLPSTIGLVSGALIFACTGHLIGHWKITLIMSFALAVVFGGLLALVTPYNQSLMMALIFLQQFFFGWAQYEAVAFVQLGVDQLDLGASGGLAGVARFGGGSLAVAVYTSVNSNSFRSKAAELIPAAGIANGLTQTAAIQLTTAIAAGAEALAAIPGINPEAIAAASVAYKEATAYGLKMLALTSLGFGGVGLILTMLCVDITPKLNNKTNVFLENDVNAEKNEFH